MRRCQLWIPDSFNTTEIERFREIIRESMSRDYDGWDDQFDRHFDNRSVWFVYVEDGEDRPLAVCRLIFRAYRSCIGPLPMEMGDKDAHAPQSGRTIVEGSGFWYARRTHGLLLLEHVMEYVVDVGVDLGYVLFDPDNLVTRRLYIDTLGLRDVPDARVSFWAFTHKRSGQPVEWHVADGRNETFKDALQTLKRITASLPSNPPRDVG